MPNPVWWNKRVKTVPLGPMIHLVRLISENDETASEHLNTAILINIHNHEYT